MSHARPAFGWFGWLSLAVLAARAAAQPVLITAPVTVGPTDTTIVDQGTAAVVPLATAQITVRGTTLTMNGRHTIASLLVGRSGSDAGVLAHTAGTSFDYSGGAGADVVLGLSLTVSGSVEVEGGSPASLIDLSGRGFGAGQGPGAGTDSNNGGFGGAGGGHGGRGADSQSTFAGGAQYGSITQPTDMGSGGGSYVGNPAGSGGGALRLQVGNTLVLNGSIIANGTSGVSASGSGSGGSVWITTNSLAGSGLIAANGGDGAGGWGGGSGGRIAVYSNSSTFTGTLRATGGSSSQPSRGASGTIYIKPSAQALPDVVLDAGGNGAPPAALTTIDLSAINTLVTRNGCNTRFTQLTQLNVPVAIAGGVTAQFDQLVNLLGDVSVDTGSNLTFNQAVAIPANVSATNGSSLVFGRPVNFPSDVTLTNGSSVQLAGGTASIQGSLALTGSGNVLRLASSVPQAFNVAGNVTIDSGSSINLNGRGFGPGQGPGAGENSNNGGFGGAGAGHGGRGADSQSAFAGGFPYGSIAQPTDMGSGGGALRLVVGNTLLLNGSITCNGTSGVSASGSGSGGSVWITTNSLAGSGSIAANGGDGAGGWGGGSGGRIAVYSNSSTFTGALRATGGLSSLPNRGASGTIYIKPSAQALPDVVLDAGGNGAPPAALTTIALPAINTLVTRNGCNARFTQLTQLNVPVALTGGVTARFDQLVNLLGDVSVDTGSNLTFNPAVVIPANISVTNGSSLVFTQPVNFPSDVTLTNGSFMQLAGGAASIQGSLALSGSGNVLQFASGVAQALTVAGIFTIDSGSSINLNGRGFGPGQGPGTGENSTNGSFGGGGAGHGGRGADAQNAFAGGAPYGSITQPIEMGSGGGSYVGNPAGSGGGAVRLVVGNTLLLNGSITCNGTSGVSASGSGSGGSVWITTNSLAGSGSIAANGGDGAGGWGGGSGGRIAVYSNSSTFTGALRATGGLSSLPNRGASGTIYIKPSAQALPDVVLDAGGNGAPPAALTTIDLPAINTLVSRNGCNGRFTQLTQLNVPVALTGGVTAQFDQLVNLIGDVSADAGSNLTFAQPVVFPGSIGVTNNSGLTLEAPLDVPGNLTLANGSRLRLPPGDNRVLGNFSLSGTGNSLLWTSGLYQNLDVGGNSTIDAGSTIDCTARGFPTDQGPGRGTASTSGSFGAAGAGHGGQGATAGPFAGGLAYGSLTNPTEPGSGGGNYVGQPGGTGGGALRLSVGNTMSLNGSIVCNGTAGSGPAGAGSGGAILIEASRLVGNGTIAANGGAAGSGSWGAGAGGRIAIYACDLTLPITNIVAGRGVSSGVQAEDGTIAFGSSSITIVQQPPSLTVLSGRPLDFPVSATTGQPDGQIAYQWRKRNQQGEYIPIQEGFGGRFTGTATNTLRVDPTECEDAGLYDCLVTDSCGSFPTRPAVIIVDPIADYNDDNAVDSDDVIDFFADWDSGRLPADLTFDGGVDSDDVIFFFSRWDIGC